MTIYHKSRVINLFSEILERAVNLRRNSIIPYVTVNTAGSEPGPDTKKIFTTKDLPDYVHQGENGDFKYKVPLFEHTHDIEKKSNHKKRDQYGFTKWFFWGPLIPTSTKVREQGNSETETEDAENSVSISVAENFSTNYFPPAVRVEQINPPLGVIFSKFEFEEKLTAEEDYYNTFKEGIDYIDASQETIRDVIVLEEDKNNANSPNIGFLGNFNAAASQPKIISHKHKLDMSNSEKTCYKFDNVGSSYERAKESEINTVANADTTVNKWIFPENSIGYCSLHSIIEPEDIPYEEKKTLEDLYSKMLDLLEISEEEKAKIEPSVIEIRQSWDAGRNHEEKMFAEAARWVIDNVRIYNFPIGTIALSGVQNDSKFVKVPEDWSILHLGKLNENVEEAGNRFMFRHGKAAHKHNFKKGLVNNGSIKPSEHNSSMASHSSYLISTQEFSVPEENNGYNDNLETDMRMRTKTMDVRYYDPFEERNYV